MIEAETEGSETEGFLTAEEDGRIVGTVGRVESQRVV